MKITTINGNEIDSDKENNLRQIFMEAIENSGLFELAIKHNAMFYVTLNHINTENTGWSKMYLPEAGIFVLISQIGSVLDRASGGKLHLAIVDKATGETYNF